MSPKTNYEWGRFVWDPVKERTNQIRHGVDFKTAAHAFLDPARVILDDERHSETEIRRYCIGRIKSRILTVRYTHRGEQIRIIGAGYWSKWRKLYEETNSI
jgi:uncharacterized DUF497 family protein